MAVVVWMCCWHSEPGKERRVEVIPVRPGRMIGCGRGREGQVRRDSLREGTKLGNARNGLPWSHKVTEGFLGG